MAHSLAIPKLGLTMTDCTLIEWLKEPGEKVERGEVLYSIETDKITTEIEADAAGYLSHAAAVDTVLEVGAIVGQLHDSRDEALNALSTPRPDHHITQPAPLPAPERDQAPRPPKLTMSAERRDGTRLMISPVARRIAGENRLSLDALSGSGPDGAVLKRDVERHLQEAASSAATLTPETRPLSGTRRAIATRMMQSLQGSAQMTAFARVDMTGSVALRRTCLDAEKNLGLRITYTDIVLKAAATALRETPAINASIIDDQLVTWSEVHIGLAIAVDGGLVVPVIRNADAKSIVDIAHDRLHLVDRARTGTLSRDDLDGGTFTISNFGSYGGDFETPILNPPQSALLGIGRIEDEPVVRAGEIVIRPMMMMSMTFDHRLIDGAVAGGFRARLRDLLENPNLHLVTLK